MFKPAQENSIECMSRVLTILRCHLGQTIADCAFLCFLEALGEFLFMSTVEGRLDR